MILLKLHEASDVSGVSVKFLIFSDSQATTD